MDSIPQQNVQKFPLLQRPEDVKPPEKGGLFAWWRNWNRSYWGELQLQLEARGPVPESEWAGRDFDPAVRDRIQKLCSKAFFDGATFHPDDPFELMYVLRYGDLIEVEILMEIEEAFDIKLFVGKNDVVDIVKNPKTTFYDIIKYVEATRQPGYIAPEYEPSTAGCLWMLAAVVGIGWGIAALGYCTKSPMIGLIGFIAGTTGFIFLISESVKAAAKNSKKIF